MASNKVIDFVNSAKVLKQGRGGLNGLVIEFETNTTMTDSNIVEITYDGKVRPYQVQEVEVNGLTLIVRAIETGYYNKLSDVKDFDLRKLIGVDVTLVTDEDRVKQIRKESCYC